MRTDDDFPLADLFAAADPASEVGIGAPTAVDLRVRDQIMGEVPRPMRAMPRPVRLLARHAGTVARRVTAPATAVAATVAVVAVAAVSVSTVPAMVAGTVIGDQSPSALEADSAEVVKAWKFAREQATSPFEEDVLADGELTLQEYREAQRLFIACVKTEGLDIQVTGSLADGTAGYEMTSARGDEATNAVVSRCGDGTIDVVEGLYMAIIGYTELLERDGDR